MCARGNAWKSLVSMPSRTPRETRATERERERKRSVYVCMCVSGVGGGRYGPGAATAASEASPFFLQAFLPPPRFSPLCNPLPCLSRHPLPSSQLPLILRLRLSSFLCEFFSLSSSLFRSQLALLPSSPRSLLVTLSQSIQPDLPSHPPVLYPRNAFQPPLTPPAGATCPPLSPGPLPPSSSPPASPLLHRGATLTPPATAQTPPNRATP